MVCGLQSVWGCWATVSLGLLGGTFPGRRQLDGGSWASHLHCPGDGRVPDSGESRLAKVQDSARICLVPTRWVLWGPMGRHTFVKMPRLPGRPPSCPPAQHSVAPGTVWAVQRRGSLQAEKQRNKAQDNRPLAGSGESRACVEASASRDRVGTITHSSSEMRGGWPRAGELGNGNDRGGPGRPEAPAPQCPLSPCPPSHSSEHRPPSQTSPLSDCAAFSLCSRCLSVLICIMEIVVLLS